MDNNRQRKQKNPTEKIKSKLSTNLMETIVEEENTKELGNNFPSNQFEKNEDQIQISNIPANKILSKTKTDLAQSPIHIRSGRTNLLRDYEKSKNVTGKKEIQSSKVIPAKNNGKKSKRVSELNQESSPKDVSQSAPKSFNFFNIGSSNSPGKNSNSNSPAKNNLLIEVDVHEQNDYENYRTLSDQEELPELRSLEYGEELNWRLNSKVSHDYFFSSLCPHFSGSKTYIRKNKKWDITRIE